MFGAPLKWVWEQLKAVMVAEAPRGCRCPARRIGVQTNHLVAAMQIPLDPQLEVK
ncbi:hypothetical protein [Mesorhizobium sp. ORS 3428]|uniref:hypothetical protein n=1 Tax=Mesorhizobium sp. ORS 3428 TaxID=540997 RepID=UPI0012FFBD6F|nr:hypothetical protein [Mesorhizobium sp. ORS 3428]